MGVNTVGGMFCGDVTFDRMKDRIGHVTPVSGGAAMLMENTLYAALFNRKEYGYDDFE